MRFTTAFVAGVFAVAASAQTGTDTAVVPDPTAAISSANAAASEAIESAVSEAEEAAASITSGATVPTNAPSGTASHSTTPEESAAAEAVRCVEACK